MTDQELFDTIARHLLTQGKRAGSREDCRYRTDSGLKCAVGCLIPHHRYTPGIEGLQVETLFVRYRDLLPGVAAANLPLLERLQDIHDDSDPVDWESELHRLAIDRDLSPAVLEEFA